MVGEGRGGEEREVEGSAVRNIRLDWTGRFLSWLRAAGIYGVRDNACISCSHLSSFLNLASIFLLLCICMYHHRTYLCFHSRT